MKTWSVYDDLECLLEKIHPCQNNLEKSFTEKKICIHLLVIQYLHIVHQTKQKINFAKKNLALIMMTKKKSQKVRDHCHHTGKFRGAAHSICNLRYKTPTEIPVVLHNGSTYDYHFIIKQLAKEFDGRFECLRENTEKYITFSVPIKKKLDNGKTIQTKVY